MSAEAIERGVTGVHVKGQGKWHLATSSSPSFVAPLFLSLPLPLPLTLS